MLKFTALFTALSAAVTSPVYALSCAPWSATGAYNAAEASGVPYDIGYGRIVPVGAVPSPGPGISYQYQARFVGSNLSNISGGAAQQIPVTVHVTCLSIWCGNVDTSAPILAFMARTGANSHALQAGPCPQWVRNNPSQAEVQQVTQCVLAGAC